MPSDEALREAAEEWKKKGNDAFAKGNTAEAISAYSQGLVDWDRIVVANNNNGSGLKATLLSNRAMCYLKMEQYQACIDDCNTALNDDHHAKNLVVSDEKLRNKLLYRRAKARFMLANEANIKSTTANDLLQDAAKDILCILQTDPNNTDAKQLLQVVRNQRKLSAVSAAGTPLGKTFQALTDALADMKQSSTSTMDYTEALHQIKMILGMLDHDIQNISNELGRLGGVTVLLDAVRDHADGSNRKFAVLALQVLSTAANHPAFVRNFLCDVQSRIVSDILQQQHCNPDLIVTALALWARIILHADRDDPKKEVSGDTRLSYESILQSLTFALSAPKDGSGAVDTTVLRAVLDVLGTWTAGPDREAAIRSALSGHSITDPTIPVPKTQQEIRAFTAQELADYKKRQYDTNTRDQAWAFSRALLFVQRGGLKSLMQAACTCSDHVVRREVTVAVGRMLAAIEDDDKIKDTVKPFLQDSSTIRRGVEEPIIEEVYNEDGDEEKVAEEEEEVTESTLETKMERALITSALLLSKKEVGAWALATGWTESSVELPQLIDSGDSRAMCLASEVLAAAASVEASRAMVTSLISSGSMGKLMNSDDRDIRSGAASAVAKLGLSDKGVDEGEIMGLLQAACDLLEDRAEETKSAIKEETSQKELKSFNSFATSSVERAIEMINYLVGNTIVKDELAAGFSAHIDAPQTALELLVKTADLPSAGESLSGFGLATIFQNMAATNEQIRKESFEGKEVTMEQYDEMQRIGKTDEEKERMDQEKDTDTSAACRERIRKMATANVPRALVALTDGASEHTLEQCVLAMNRMADEPSVRGVMIQQGVLSACIKIEKNEGPTETDVMKKVIRLSRHCIAKLLITTNPSLLTSAQKLGSIRPLIQLVRDIKASDLQHFEALLAVTNIASAGDDAKNRIVTEKGISSFHFAMFSDHEMVRRAATEAMCNLVPHQKMMDHLAEEENLKLWLAFAVDYEDNYECARAATGCLAMATQDEIIAQELTKNSKFKERLSSLLESGRLEIMHRAFCIVLNLVAISPETCAKTVEAGLVEFCRAYIELQNHSKNDLDFSAEERQLIPVTIDLAKKIVHAADNNS
jgi:tetratricopeptide (TPR) repeat protein